MKILFCCSGLQPGRDGVGDYTRLLAGECTRLGHTCGIIALNDFHVTEVTESALDAAGKKIPCLRLPSTSLWARRVERAKDFRSRFGPDWISLQVVPHGLNSRGILTALTPGLLELTSGCPLHLMFHELWTGGTGLARLRRRLAGTVQRLSLKPVITALRPRLVTTSNPVYIAMLKSIGTTAALLPLFGNVPIAPLPSPPELPPQLVEAGLPQDGPGRRAWWVVIFFGSIHPEWKPEPFLGILRRTARRAGKHVALLQAGRAGSNGDAIWEKIRRAYRSDFVLIRFGELPVDALSSLLQIADFGVATSPWHLLGKSGTAAAMLDHGLPVVVTRDDFRPTLPLGEYPAPDPLLHRCDETLEAKLFQGLARQSPRARLGEISTQLCQQFHNLSDHHP